MSDQLNVKKIATIYTDFPEKFGIPRQSGLTGASGKLVFEPEYRVKEAVRGIEEYSHLWLIWGFSEVKQKKWSPTVRPPRLGGNVRMGVFATRSPFRPNPIGLSSVKLERVEETEEGIVLYVSGVDMLDGTPIYDIKPYLAYVDSHPEAEDGFAGRKRGYRLQVEISEEHLNLLPEEKREVLLELLSQDPRPAYQKDENRIYGMSFAEYEVYFRVLEECLSVTEMKRRAQ